jgi:hypothetical protein
LAKPAGALCLLLLLAVGAAGCGGEEGVADGAVVKAYVEAPLCDDGAAAPVAVSDGGSAEVSVRFVCLPPVRGPGLSQGVGGGRQIDLAAAGANARRAAEDSTTVAYLRADDPAVNRFTEPILEAAGIGWITGSSGKAYAELLGLLAEADSNSLRADVRDALGQS